MVVHLLFLAFSGLAFLEGPFPLAKKSSSALNNPEHGLLMI